MTRVDGDEISRRFANRIDSAKGGWPELENRTIAKMPASVEDQQAILPLENQHRIPVAEEAVVLRDRLPIGRQRRLPTGENAKTKARSVLSGK